MGKLLATGLWICALTLISCYMAVHWGAGLKLAKEEEYFEGLDYQKVRPVTVPVVAEGSVQGYVVISLVFTADAQTLRSLPIPPYSFIIDETFRLIYSDERLDFRRLAKYNVNELIQNIKRNTNKRLGAEIVKDLMIENFNFVSKSEVPS